MCTCLNIQWRLTVSLPLLFPGSFRWGSVWLDMMWRSDVRSKRKTMTWPKRRRSWWRSTGGASTSSWKSTTCWTWQWSVVNGYWWWRFTCVTAEGLCAWWKRNIFVRGVGVKEEEKWWHMWKNCDLFFLNWILFCFSTMSLGNTGCRFIPNRGSSLPSTFSRSPFSPHQAPCVNRHIQEGEKNKRSSEQTVRCRKCSAQTKQPTWHTVHPCCST